MTAETPIADTLVGKCEIFSPDSRSPEAPLYTKQSAPGLFSPQLKFTRLTIFHSHQWMDERNPFDAQRAKGKA